MTKSIRIDITLSPPCLAILEELKVIHKTTNQSEIIEWLILSQKHSRDEVARMLQSRPKRGRRWPVKVSTSKAAE